MLRYNPATIVPIFVAIVVVGGFLFANANRERFLGDSMAQIKTQEPAPSPDPMLIAENPDPNSSGSVSIRIDSQVTDTELNAKLQQQPMISLLNFKYPGATTKSESEKKLELVSIVSPNMITDWYKEQIKSLGFTTQSSNVTNTNNIVENKLVSSNGNQTITIDIKKAASAKETEIRVTLE